MTMILTKDECEAWNTMNRVRSSHWGCSVKKAVFKNLAILTGKHLCWGHFLIKLQVFRSAIYQKETLTQMFSCEYCEIFKNTHFEKTSANDCFCRVDAL